MACLRKAWRVPGASVHHLGVLVGDDRLVSGLVDVGLALAGLVDLGPVLAGTCLWKQ